MGMLTVNDIVEFIDNDVLGEDGDVAEFCDEHAVEEDFTRAAMIAGMSMLADFLFDKLRDGDDPRLHHALDKLSEKLGTLSEKHLHHLE